MQCSQCIHGSSRTCFLVWMAANQICIYYNKNNLLSTCSQSCLWISAVCSDPVLGEKCWDAYRLCVWCRPGGWSPSISASASGGPSLWSLGCGEHWLNSSAAQCQKPATILSASLRQAAQTGMLNSKTLNTHHCNSYHTAMLHPNETKYSRAEHSLIQLSWIIQASEIFSCRWIIVKYKMRVKFFSKCLFVSHLLGWAEAWGGRGIWAFPRQERAWRRFSQCQVKAIHSYWRHLLCGPPVSDPAWGCCTEAGWDL